MNKNNVVIVVLMLIIGVGAFAGGMKYQQGKTLSQRIQIAEQFGNRANGVGASNNGVGRTDNARGNGQLVGEILSVDEKSITIKTVDGSSKIILINDKTIINKATEGQTNDLKIGEKVAVFGSTNTDGSVSGQNIQINPIIRAMLSVSPTKTN